MATFFAIFGIVVFTIFAIYFVFMKFRETLLCRLGIHESECFMIEDNLILRCRYCMEIEDRKVRQI